MRRETFPGEAGRRARGGRSGALILCALAAFTAACGISLGADSETEIFKELRVSGDLRAGGEVTLELDYEQPYPVDLTVACILLTTDPAPTPTPTPTEVLPRGVPTPTPTPLPIPLPEPTPRNKVLDIAEVELEANEMGGTADEAEPVAATLVSSFQAPGEPGRYVVRCYTPADDNNAIAEEITIAG